MALVGDVTLYKRAVVGTEEIEVENADGVVETQEQEVWDEVEDKTIENAYVIIRMCAFHTDDYDRFVNNMDGEEVEIETPRGETKNPYYLVYRYNIYESKENRQDRFFKPMEEIDTEMMIPVNDLTLGGQTMFEYSYNHLKTQKGFENLDND